MVPLVNFIYRTCYVNRGQCETTEQMLLRFVQERSQKLMNPFNPTHLIRIPQMEKRNDIYITLQNGSRVTQDYYGVIYTLPSKRSKWAKTDMYAFIPPRCCYLSSLATRFLHNTLQVVPVLGPPLKFQGAGLEGCRKG